jgi:hypothetical protein
LWICRLIIHGQIECFVKLFATAGAVFLIIQIQLNVSNVILGCPNIFELFLMRYNSSHCRFQLFQFQKSHNF